MRSAIIRDRMYWSCALRIGNGRCVEADRNEGHDASAGSTEGIANGHPMQNGCFSAVKRAMEVKKPYIIWRKLSWKDVSRFLICQNKKQEGCRKAAFWLGSGGVGGERKRRGSISL